MSGTSESHDERIADMVTALSRIPDSARSFTVSGAAAESELRIDRALQEALRGQGVPCRRRGADWHYDGTDLLNIALGLDIGSRPRKMLHWWARELERPYETEHAYCISYLTSCPDPSSHSDCEFTFVGASATSRTVLRRASAEAFSHNEVFTLPRVWPQFPDKLVELLDEYRRIRYLRLPNPLCWSVDFILESGVADCGGFAKMVTFEGRRRGFETRFSYGRALTPPFSSDHFWAEFKVDGVWVPVDSLFVDALIGWNILDARRWDRYRSLGAIMARMSDSFNPLALHNGEPVPVHTQVFNA